MGWPEWSVRLLSEFLAKEPSPIVRVEATVAQLAALYVNAHRKKGVSAHKISEFLLFDNPWQTEDHEDEDESITDFALSFGMVKRGNDNR